VGWQVTHLAKEIEAEPATRMRKAKSVDSAASVTLPVFSYQIETTVKTDRSQEMKSKLRLLSCAHASETEKLSPAVLVFLRQGDQWTLHSAGILEGISFYEPPCVSGKQVPWKLDINVVDYRMINGFLASYYETIKNISSDPTIFRS
jgi:hypothetical protein